MSATSPSETGAFPFPIRLQYERPDGRLQVVVDAAPAAVDDITVEAGRARVRVTIDRDGDVYDRTIAALPPRRVFDGERNAVYNNGVLSVSLETIPRWRAPRVR